MKGFEKIKELRDCLVESIKYMDFEPYKLCELNEALGSVTINGSCMGKYIRVLPGLNVIIRENGGNCKIMYNMDCNKVYLMKRINDGDLLNIINSDHMWNTPTPDVIDFINKIYDVDMVSIKTLGEEEDIKEFLMCCFVNNMIPDIYIACCPYDSILSKYVFIERDSEYKFKKMINFKKF